MLNLLKKYPHQDLTERFNALIDQGMKYNKVDYLPTTSSNNEINEQCRNVMVKWCYKITSHCNYSPETSCVAMYLLDQFLSTLEGQFALHDRRMYQLASVCCLQLAIKMYEIKKLDMSSLSKLCRDFFTNEEFSYVESTILSSLQWCLNPPTPYTYLELFLDLLPPTSYSNIRLITRELAQKQIYNSMQDYYFVTINPCDIALSCMLNALEEIQFKSNDLFSFLHNVILVTGMDCTNPSIVSYRYRLLFSGIIHEQNDKKDHVRQHSPVCVDLTRGNY